MAAGTALFVVGSAFDAPLTSLDEIFHQVAGEGRIEAAGKDTGFIHCSFSCGLSCLCSILTRTWSKIPETPSMRCGVKLAAPCNRLGRGKGI